MLTELFRLPMAAFALATVLALCAVPARAQQSNCRVWAADSLMKVLPASPVPPGAESAVRLDCARGEYENAQVVVTAGNAPVTVALEVAPVKGPAGPKPHLRAAFLGFVPVQLGTKDTPPEHLVTSAPASIPDPILEVSAVEVPAGTSQPVWLSAQVPLTAAPGEYSSELTITAGEQRFSVPVSLRVRRAAVPAERTLLVTNWFSTGNIASGHGLRKWSEGYWKMLEAYARVMADHRQNVVLTPLFELVKAREDAKGALTFDFSRLDRWVELFTKAGVLGTIEGGHLASRGAWEDPDFNGTRPETTIPDGSVKKWEPAKVTSPEQRQFLSQFLPALQSHLEARGWLKHYVQHLTDEPIPINAASYNTLAGMVREFAPNLRTIDATMCREVAGSVDVWVPQPEELDQHPDFFAERRKAGDDVWFYTCLAPKGKYMNRFIDYHTLSTRLLHWMNYRYGLPGYLHWGFNYWQADPFKDLEPNWGGDTHLPPGDSHIVYPGKRGPMPSIRLEAMRDGIEDYELLRLLAKSNKKAADGICVSVARSWTDYTLDPAEFRRARTKLLDALEEIQ